MGEFINAEFIVVTFVIFDIVIFWLNSEQLENNESKFVSPVPVKNVIGFAPLVPPLLNFKQYVNALNSVVIFGIFISHTFPNMSGVCRPNLTRWLNTTQLENISTIVVTSFIFEIVTG
jgi:hypothetical protein